MGDLSVFYGPNAGYVLEQYDQYVADPAAAIGEIEQIGAAHEQA